MKKGGKKMKEAERKLYEKGYYLSNQFDGFGTVPNEYELAGRNGNTIIIINYWIARSRNIRNFFYFGDFLK